MKKIAGQEMVEGWTHVMVDFGDEYVTLNGRFTVDELRLIASIQAKREKDERNTGNS